MLRWRFRIRFGTSRKRAARPEPPPRRPGPPGAQPASAGGLEPVEAEAEARGEADTPAPALEIRLPGASSQALETRPEEATPTPWPEQAAPAPGPEQAPEPEEATPAPGALPGEVMEPPATLPVDEEAGPDEVDESAPLPAPPPLVGVSCPNCGEELTHRPMGQSPCPHCGRTIHVRARQGIFRSGLVGEGDVDAVDFLESVERFGVSEAACRRRLQEAGGQDLVRVLWQVCEERLEALPEAGRNQLLEEMAMFRKFRGEEHASLRRRAAASLLRRLQTEGARRVSIVARGGECCPVCGICSGREMDVEEALAQEPLPVEGCTRSDGLCRCTYLSAPA